MNRRSPANAPRILHASYHARTEMRKESQASADVAVEKVRRLLGCGYSKPSDGVVVKVPSSVGSIVVAFSRYIMVPTSVGCIVVTDQTSGGSKVAPAKSATALASGSLHSIKSK